MRKKYLLSIVLFFWIILLGLWGFRFYFRRSFQVVMCAGDSITAEAYPNYLQEKLNQAGIRIKVVNKGVKGNTSGEYLKYLTSHPVLQEVNPHIVLLQLGTNDVRIDGDQTPTDQFIHNLNRIIDLIQNYTGPDGRRPKILLATIPPLIIDENHRRVFNQASQRRIVEEINPAIIKIAKSRGLALLDIYQLFQEHPEFLTGVHPTQEGYKAMAEAWFNQLNPLVSSH